MEAASVPANVLNVLQTQHLKGSVPPDGFPRVPPLAVGGHSHLPSARACGQSQASPQGVTWVVCGPSLEHAKGSLDAVPRRTPSSGGGAVHPGGVEPTPEEGNVLVIASWDRTLATHCLGQHQPYKPSRLLDLSLDQHLPLFPESHSLLHQSTVNLGHQECMGGGGRFQRIKLDKKQILEASGKCQWPQSNPVRNGGILLSSQPSGVWDRKLASTKPASDT